MDDMAARMAGLKEIYSKANGSRMSHKKKPMDMANMSYEDYQEHQKGMDEKPLLTISIIAGSDEPEVLGMPEEDPEENIMG